MLKKKLIDFSAFPWIIDVIIKRSINNRLCQYQYWKLITGKIEYIISYICLLFVSFRYEIMMNCWQQDPELRPGFDSLQKNMKEMEKQHKVLHCSERNL